MNSFTYKFEELPLVIVDGVEAMFTNGCATIGYFKDGEWNVGFGSVCVESYKSISLGERLEGKSPWSYVAAPSPFADIIIKRLKLEWRDRVSSAVLDQLEKDHASAADNHADILHARRVEAA